MKIECYRVGWIHPRTGFQRANACSQPNYKGQDSCSFVAYSMWILYQIAMVLALVLAGPFLLLLRGRHYLGSLPGRLGRYTGDVPSAPLWIHAVSVGEVGVAHTLLRGLPADLPILVTTVTPTGQARALSLFKGRASVAYLPFDLQPVVEKFLNRFNPSGLVLVEGDLWPLLLSRVKARGLAIAVVNGRVSDHSFRRMRRLKPILKPLFLPVDRFGMQSAVDRQRLLDLDVPEQRVVVTGNLKFDTAPQKANPVLASAIQLLAAGRPILVAGSTMAGEDEQVLAALAQIGGGDRALLVLAPRHPERWSEVADLVGEKGFSLAKRTQLDDFAGKPDVLLLDTLGELAAIYAIGVGCFIGGTLVPTGGHNPLEAAQHAVAISVGPSMENFREIAQAFRQSHAWQQVADAAELGRVWDAWLAKPATAESLGNKGAQVVAANQGSLATTMALLEPLFQDSTMAALQADADSRL